MNFRHLCLQHLNRHYKKSPQDCSDSFPPYSYNEISPFLHTVNEKLDGGKAWKYTIIQPVSYSFIVSKTRV